MTRRLTRRVVVCCSPCLASPSEVRGCRTRSVRDAHQWELVVVDVAVSDVI